MINGTVACLQLCYVYYFLEIFPNIRFELLKSSRVLFHISCFEKPPLFSGGHTGNCKVASLRIPNGVKRVTIASVTSSSRWIHLTNRMKVQGTTFANIPHAQRSFIPCGITLLNKSRCHVHQCPIIWADYNSCLMWFCLCLCSFIAYIWAFSMFLIPLTDFHHWIVSDFKCREITAFERHIILFLIYIF